MIGMNGASYIVGMSGNGLQTATSGLRSVVPSLGVNLPRLEEAAMFKLSAYDPIGIALLGFGVLAVAGLAFVY
jgi:hypothetical protein